MKVPLHPNMLIKICTAEVFRFFIAVTVALIFARKVVPPLGLVLVTDAFRLCFVKVIQDHHRFLLVSNGLAGVFLHIINMDEALEFVFNASLSTLLLPGLELPRFWPQLQQAGPLCWR